MASRAKMLAPLEAAYRSGVMERIGDILARLPELRAVMQQREVALMDCDAYARKVCDVLCVGRNV